LQLIQNTIRGIEKLVIEKALCYCLRNKLYSASDFGDAVRYFRYIDQSATHEIEPFSSAEIKTIDPANSCKLKIKPMVRDLNAYKFSLTGGV